MTDIATLGLKVDSSQVKSATSDLNALAAASKNTTTAIGAQATVMPAAAKAAATVAASTVAITAAAAPATAAIKGIETAQAAGTISAASMAAALKATGGSLAAVTPQMVGLATAAEAAAPALVGVGEAAGVATVATTELAAANAGVTREMIVLGSEALRGNFSRIPGSILVMKERLGEAGASALSLKTVFGLVGGIAEVAFSSTVLTIIGVTVALHEIPKIFGAISSSVGSATDVMKQHDQTIQKIKSDWDDAAKSSEQYGSRVQAAIKFSINADQQRLQSLLSSQLQNIPFDLGFAAGSRSPLASYQNAFGPLTATVLAFRQQALQGKGDVLAFDEQIQKLANSNPSDTALRKIAQHLIDVTKGATDSADALKALGLTAEQMDPVFQAAVAHAKFLADNTFALLDDQRRQSAALLGVSARSPSERSAAASASVLAEPVNPDESTQVRNYRASAAGALAAAQAEESLADAGQDRVRAIKDAIGASEIDISTLGKSAEQIDLAKANWASYTTLRAEAEQNHIAFDNAQYARLVRENEELAKLKQSEAELSQMRDLAFAASQLGRTDTEQSAASAMRDLYGDDYQSHMNDAIAGQIRLNAQLSATKDTASGALSTFVSDIRQGKSGVDSLTDALGNVEDKLLDLAENQVIAGLFGGGNSTSGGLIGSIISAFTGGGVATGAPLNIVPTHHTGYGPGDPLTTGRFVHPAYFDNAPRFHTGIGPGERPAVIRNDESVLTPGQMRQLTPAGQSMGLEITINNAPAGTTATQTRGANGKPGLAINFPRAMDDANAAAIASGESATNRELERRYGLTPR